MDLATLKYQLGQYRYRFDTETDLQMRVEDALKDIGAEYHREFPLDGRNRIDFLVGDVGIEIKVDGSLTEVARQVHRYLGFQTVGSLLLITTRGTHKKMARSMQGKELDILVVGGLL